MLLLPGTPSPDFNPRLVTSDLSCSSEPASLSPFLTTSKHHPAVLSITDMVLLSPAVGGLLRDE